MAKVLTIYFENDVLVRRAGRLGKNSIPEEAVDFDDTLDYVFVCHYDTPRVYWSSQKTGRKYSMFLDVFDSAVRLKLFQNNQLTARFRFEKRGQSQAIKINWTPEQKAELIRIWAEPRGFNLP